MFTLVLPLWAVITLGVYLGLGLLIGIWTAVLFAIPILNRGEQIGLDFANGVSNAFGSGFAWPFSLIRAALFFLPFE